MKTGLAGCGCVFLVAALCFGADQSTPVKTSAERPRRDVRSSALDEFSGAVQTLSSRVSASVVQIVVAGYGPRGGSTTSSQTGAVVESQVLGSGVIVDPDGYILTNAHVVSDAHRIRVNLYTKQDQSVAGVLDRAVAPFLDATLVGMFKEADLALLKIPAKGLPALKFADYRNLRQGQLVFTFGSPEGLSNSMSMGVVSSVARQSDPDSPFIFIQTDAPINPGNSGGPLVNAMGDIVGINTFILTKSGGNEGLGFAIPSPLAEFVYGQLRKYGHFHRPLIGAGVQAITPTLAAALKLPRTSGVIVSDIQPQGPAETAGMRLGDVVLAVDGSDVHNVPMFMMSMLHGNQKIQMQVLRGDETVVLDISTEEEEHAVDRLSGAVDPEKSLIPKLGILGIAIDKQTATLFPHLRGPYGVAVAAMSGLPMGTSAPLQVGDVVHEVNGAAVESVDGLRQAIDALPAGSAVALFIEREGKLQYLAFELE